MDYINLDNEFDYTNYKYGLVFGLLFGILYVLLFK
jgi:hypothetical protein